MNFDFSKTYPLLPLRDAVVFPHTTRRILVGRDMSLRALEFAESHNNEIVLVVDENNEIDDMTLYALGLKSKDDIDALAAAAKDQSQVEHEQEKWSYEDICNMEFRTIFPADCYSKGANGLYTDLRTTQEGLKLLYGSRVLLRDSNDNRYEIPDLRQLDKRSRQLLDSFL